MVATPNRRSRRPDEEGYILAVVMIMLAVFLISLSVAVPKVREEIQRDREVETMHRGRQYVRAIQLYYRKFGAYPPNVDALLKANNIRFLRKKYIDPMTGKDDWKPILFGQNKTPTAMGFFGQPLAGSMVAGIGPSGGNGLAGTTPASTDPGSAAGSGTSSPANGQASATTDPNGTSAPGTGSGTGSNLSGQAFGGGGIIGFSPGSPKQSILVLKKKNHYNEWEFTYDPLSDRLTIPGSSPGQPPLQSGAPGMAPTPSPSPTPNAISPSPTTNQ
jgi:type II secretory pathway pseudopilin PulG